MQDINQKLYSACVGNDAKKVEEYLKSKKVDPNWQNKEEVCTYNLFGNLICLS